MADQIYKFGTSSAVTTGWGGGPALAYNKVFTSADIDLETATSDEFYTMMQTAGTFATDANWVAGESIYIGYIELRTDATTVYPAGLTASSAETSTAATVTLIKNATKPIDVITCSAASQSLSTVCSFSPIAKKIKLVLWVDCASSSAEVTGSTWYSTPIALGAST